MTLFQCLMLADTLFSLLIFIIWNTDSYLNQAIKAICGILTLANIVGVLFAFGFVVKIVS